MGRSLWLRAGMQAESDLVQSHPHIFNLPKWRQFNVWCFPSDSLTLISLLQLRSSSGSLRLAVAITCLLCNSLLSRSLYLSHIHTVSLCLLLSRPCNASFTITSTSLHIPLQTFYTDQLCLNTEPRHCQINHLARQSRSKKAEESLKTTTGTKAISKKGVQCPWYPQWQQQGK